MIRRWLSVPLLLASLLSPSLARADGDPGDQPVQGSASGDVVTLKDGRRLEGEIVGEDERFVSLRSGGVTRSYAKDSVASVERAARAPAVAGLPGGTEPTPAPSGETAGKKTKERADRKDAPLSDAARSWLDELIARSADADEVVRRSIGAAIGAIGRQAIPALRAAESAAADGPQKQFLGRLAADMESRRDKRGREPGTPPDGRTADGAMRGEEPGPPPAGRAGGPRRMLEETMQRLATELELRDDQKPKVEAILEDALQKRFEVLREARRDGLGPEAVAAKVEPLRTALLAEMKKALDEPQYALFEEIAQRLFEAPRGPAPPKPKEPGAQPTDPRPGEAR